MFVRRRPLLRAAVIGGGAYAAGRHMGRAAEQRDYAEAEQDQRIGDLEQQAPPSQQGSAPAPAVAEPSMTDQLSQLNTLHQQGVLTDAEFGAAKAKLLGT